MNPRKLAIWLCAIALSAQAPTNAQGAHPSNKTGGKTSSAAASQKVPSQTNSTKQTSPTPGTIDAAHPHGYQQDEALIKAIRDAKVIDTEYPLRLVKNKDECLVTTLLNPKATEKNLKVEAVLVAKALMEADKTVLIVHYRMKNRMRDPAYQVIIVGQGNYTWFIGISQQSHAGYQT